MEERSITDRLAKLAARKPVSFHVPGHKNGRIKGAPEFLKEAGRLDLTELPETDNLHSPSGMIRQAQERAARLYGAKESHFLVNGTTGGILAAVSAIARPGDAVLMQRDCHRSVYHAVAINRLKPVYISPAFTEDGRRKLSVTRRQVEEALEGNPGIRLVILTYPSYDGICSDLGAISRAVRKSGAVLMIDGAHSAHLGFSDAFPDSPIALGADVVVQSTHKTLPAFTQGSMLHIASDRIDTRRMRDMLAVYQSSSPSYLLMAGIDSAIGIMEKEGQHMADRLSGEIRLFTDKLKRKTDIRVDARDEFLSSTGFDLDESKITLDFTDAGLSGFQAGEILRKKYGIYVEMDGLRSVLLVASVANTRHDFDRAFSSIEAIAADKTLSRRKITVPEYSYSIPEMALLPGEAFYRRAKKVGLSEAAGKISGEYMAPFPPGIPLVCPGETIPEETVEYLKALHECKTRNTEIQEPLLEHAWIIEDEEVVRE